MASNPTKAATENPAQNWLTRIELPRTPTAITLTGDDLIWVAFREGCFVANYARTGECLSTHGVPKVPKDLRAGPNNTLSILCSSRADVWGRPSPENSVVTIDRAGKLLSQTTFPRKLRQHVIEKSGRRLILDTMLRSWSEEQAPVDLSYVSNTDQLTLDTVGNGWLRSNNTIYEVAKTSRPRNSPGLPWLKLFVNGTVNGEKISAFAPVVGGVWASYCRSEYDETTTLRKLGERSGTVRGAAFWTAELRLSDHKVSHLVATKDGGVWAMCPEDSQIFRVSPTGRLIEKRSLYAKATTHRQVVALRGLVLSSDERTLCTTSVDRNELLVIDVSTNL